MSKIQGRMKQLRKYTTSRYIMHFGTATAWVEHGRIHIVNEGTGQPWSCDWETWIQRAFQIYTNSKQMSDIFSDQGWKMRTCAEKMLQLGNFARRQKQPPILTASEAKAIRSQCNLYIPGQTGDGPRKLHVPGQQALPKPKQLYLPDGYRNGHNAHAS